MLAIIVAIASLQTMATVEVSYLGFDNQPHTGKIVVDQRLAKDVQAIFKELRAIKFPIEKVIPIAAYHGSDQLSMADNNTSGYNYRTVPGSKRLSNHAYGRAIDINPRQNPWLSRNGKPKTPTSPGSKGKITKDVVKIFRKYGWKWGGNWKHAKDLQHFEKPR